MPAKNTTSANSKMILPQKSKIAQYDVEEKEDLGPEDLYLPKSTAYGKLVSQRHPLAPSSIAYRQLASKIFYTHDYFEPTISEQLRIWMRRY